MFPPRRRGRPILRILGVSILGLGIAALVALVAFVVFFNPNSLKPRIVAYVKRETGRDIDIKGPIRISMSLTPTIDASDIELSNASGGTSPTMATVARAEAEVSLLPLLSHRLVVTRLVLLQPHLLLERTSSGSPNWRFSPDAAAGEPAGAAPAGGQTQAAKLRLAIQSLHIRDGEIRVRPMGGLGPTIVAIARLDATSASIDSPISAKADLTINDMPVTADITTGSLSRVQDASAATPWPFNVTFEGTGLRLAMAGDARRPAEGRGYQATVDGELTDGNPFGADIAKIAPMRDVRFIGRVADSPSGDPVWTKLSLRGAGGDSPNPIADLRIASFAFTADDMNEPIHVDLRGDYRDSSFTVTGAASTPAGYVAARRGGPLPLDLAAQYAGAALHAAGRIGAYSTLSDVDIAFDWTVPDLINLSTVARVLLPSQHGVAMTGHVTDADGSLFRGVALKGFKLTAPLGDLSGDIAWVFFGRPSLRATIDSRHLDASGLGGLLWAMLPASGAAPPKAPPANSGQPGAPDASRAFAEVRPVFSNRPIPVGFIRDTDLDIVLNLADLVAVGGDYTNVVVHAFAQNGDMLIEPLSAQFGAAKIDGRIGVNAGQVPPAFLAEANAPAVSIAPLLAAFGLPGDASGTAAVKFALKGAGDTPHRLASTLDGGFTVAAADADIGNSVLTQALGGVMRGARLPDSFGAGRTRLRCFAARGEVAHGDVKLPMLALDTSNLAFQGAGDIDLGEERIGLRVRPIFKLAGKEFSAPIRIAGLLTAPKGSIDALAAIAGLSEKDKGDACAAALASVRNVQPEPETPSSAAGAARAGEAPKPGPATPGRGSKG